MQQIRGKINFPPARGCMNDLTSLKAAGLKMDFCCGRHKTSLSPYSTSVAEIFERLGGEADFGE